MVSFGKVFGFLFIWTFIIIILPASFALTALTFADYALEPFFPSCTPPFASRILLAACSLCKNYTIHTFLYSNKMHQFILIQLIK